MAIGDQIKRLRQEKGLTQEVVATALDVTRQAVAKWESNQAAPSTVNLIKLAELFHVQLEELTCIDGDTSTMQEYFIKKVKDEEKRNIVLKQLRHLILEVCVITAAYVALSLICWVCFHLLGIPDYIWNWITEHYALCLSGCAAVLAMLCGLKWLSWLMLAGTAVGIVAGNIAGSISENTSSLGFNTGWMVFLLCLYAGAAAGVGLEFLRSKNRRQSLIPAKGKRVLTSVLAALLIVSVIFSAYSSWQRLAYNSGAEAGYQSGLKAGREDSVAGKPLDARLLEGDVPESYSFGSSAYKGYMVYWPHGYKTGYTNGN